jgi:hypothetical protein
MKTKEMNLADLEVTNIIKAGQKMGSLRRRAAFTARFPGRCDLPIVAFPWLFSSLLTVLYLSFVPLTIAHGNSGGHNSGMGHGNGGRNDHWGYPGPFWGPSYPYQVGVYGSAYWYTPTPEQRTKAKEEVAAYLKAVNKGRKHAAAHRYISVETLKPTKMQLQDYTRKQPAGRRVEPEQLRCLMVFDTQTKEFVGSGCYVVSKKPLVGEVAQFETVSAEFVGHETL